MRMSSKYITTKTSRRSIKILFINCWKTEGALERPKGITSHLNNP